MKNSLLGIIIIFGSIGCISSPTKKVGSENIFFIDGEKVLVTGKFLADVRSRWIGKTNVIVSSKLLKKSDVRWTLDYIALMEILNSKECKKYFVVATRKFDLNSEYQMEPKNITPGLFDYAWDIDVCGKLHTYRVVNKKGSNSFEVYPTKL